MEAMESHLDFMYITNDPDIAKIIQKAGVKRIWIDLEKLGKQERQSHINSVKSDHSIADIKVLRPIISDSELLVRINPINEESLDEINKVILHGADIIMLPMFRTKSEVQLFLDYVAGRVKTVLLLETKDGVENIDDILSLGGIDEIHIGLNDLHLEYHLDFMFELLSNGTVEYLCQKINNYRLPYGFGGIAKIGEGLLPAEYVIAEHYRLGSKMAILSRSFCDATVRGTNLDIWENEFVEGLLKIRKYEEELWLKNELFFEQNKEKVTNGIMQICNIIKNKRSND